MVRGELLFQAIESTFSDPQLTHLRAETLTALLRELGVFSAATDRQLREVADLAKVARVSAGQIIIREGASSEALYVLLTGSAAVSRAEHVHARLRRGEVFGDVGIFSGAPRSGTVTAERDLWLLRISADDLQALFTSEPAIADAVFPERSEA